MHGEYVKLVEETLNENIDYADDDMTMMVPQQKKVGKDIVGLSAGTIATLTGFTNTKEQDKFMDAWWEFYVNSDMIYKDWKDAFNTFMSEYGVKVTNGKAKPNDIKKKIL